MAMEVETRRRTQDGNRGGNGDGDESSSRDGNGDEDGNGDGNENGIEEGGRQTKKRKKPYKHCRRDQALFFRTRQHRCRQRVALPGIRQIHSQGLLPVHAHRTEGVTGSEGREGAKRGRGRDRSWGRE